jgi:hypothetical protein
MEFIVKQKNERWNSGFYWVEMSFSDVCRFFQGEEDSEVDEMVESVANLNINESFSIDFFGGNSYTFKRIN